TMLGSQPLHPCIDDEKSYCGENKCEGADLTGKGILQFCRGDCDIDEARQPYEKDELVEAGSPLPITLRVPGREADSEDHEHWSENGQGGQHRFSLMTRLVARVSLLLLHC